jgi:Spy/CpxP family protein refolding chaperone
MMRKTTMLVVGAAALVGLGAYAQHAPSPYAGQETRAVKALSEEEARDLLGGNGMGLAKAAELNGYPGPRHVLDLAKELALTADQLRAVESVHGRMKDEAVAVGRAMIEREESLDRLFAQRRIDEAQLAALTSEIGGLAGRLRAAHLKAHLETTKLLSEHQVHQYAQLRGYAGGAPGAHKH